MKKFIRGIITGLAVASAFMIFGAGKTLAMDAEGNTVIVIDAGHGGKDPGTISPVTGAKEAQINSAIALAMRDELVKYDKVKVYFTHPDDVLITNTGRSMVASALNADFLISLHNNSSQVATASGCISYRSVNNLYAQKTNDLASLATDNLSKLGLKNLGVETRVSTKYAEEDYYTLIGEAVRVGIPAIIIEHCFLTNAADAAFVSGDGGTLNEANIKKLGIADAQACISYFKLTPKTVTVDGQGAITLEKNYKVTAKAMSTGSKVTWLSVDATVASVDSEGVITAVNPGTTNIVAKLADGSQQALRVIVNEPKPVAISSCLDPTFYETREALNAINLANMLTMEIYSDGSVQSVTAESVGTVDKSSTGIQDIPVTYKGLTGSLRIIYDGPEYVPQVTIPAPTQAPTTTVATTAEPQQTKPVDESSVSTETSKTPSESSAEKTDRLMTILIFALALLILVIIATLIILLCNSRRRGGRRNRKRGRYYR